LADDGLTNEAVEGELEERYVRKREDDGRDGVPGLPRRSFLRLHHPILLLANSPYLERKEGSGESREEGRDMERTLITMDGKQVHRNLSGENE
jgi:hypothetical protein